ncbi:hypothetical protein [Pseudobutyrivibrio sp.]|uniref:hypothetical protein n=1 Tax=Pseudobutyrivibrio sp. TaxID=2014367 RepID=UPI0025D4DC01|nr:hypothetical protein [Pseudobutyrivibrio sp.]
MKKYKFIGIVAFIIIFGLFIINVIKVNKRCPQVVYKDIEIGETSSWTEELELTINGARLFSSEEAVVRYGDGILSDMVDGIDFKVVEVDATVTNKTDLPIIGYLYDLYMENLVFANGIAAEIQMNTDTDRLDIQLNPKEYKNVILCYVIYDNQFSNKDWDSISTKSFWLAGEHYPVKKRWHFV